MSQSELTAAQYRAVTGEPPPGAGGDEAPPPDDAPIALLPADQVQEFRDRLGERLGQEVIVRVPNAREWQHALLAGGAALLEGSPQLGKYDRAGNVSLDPRLANLRSDEFDDAYQDLTFQGHEDGYNRYAPVKSYPPNRWLLYDMLGNVSEWVSAKGGRQLDSIGGSFRDAWDTPHTTPHRRGQGTAFDDIGLRIVVLPAP
jgi:formylglycine-generating enzyme required for sulfatase activity